MSFREQLNSAGTAKEKAAVLQSCLGKMSAEAVDDYALLMECSQGDHGADIRGYAVKCLQFADKKFPTLKETYEGKKKEQLDQLIARKADNPTVKYCTFCLQEIPFEALKCHYCGEFAPVEITPEIRNTYPVSCLEIFKQAKKMGASDIHLSVGFHPIFRISGDMIHIQKMPVIQPSDSLSLAYQVLTDDGKRLFETEKEVDQAFDIPGVCRLRLNVAQERRGAATVARILPSKILSMDDLRFRNKEVFVKLCMEVNGLIVVTGPTGSGKSTTLAAMIDYVNTFRNEHIITIEDPIEFVHVPKKSKVMQRELRTNTKSFYAALRSALRQDPDVMLIGEMRDRETTELALEAAETGHLVFGTLHTNSAAKTVDRIINMFSAEDQNQVRTTLAENLKGIIAQVLIKKEGGGRCAAQEIMLKSTAISNLIREGKTFQINEYISTARELGMQTMDDEIRRLLDSGDISKENAYRYSINKADFAFTPEQKAESGDKK